MATNNAVNTSLSGQTGTGNFVGANTPTLITPVLGAATATSVNFGGSSLANYIATSSFTPTFTFATAGNLSVSYASQLGYYAQIGSMVIANIYLSFTPTYTTSSGQAIISGLPVRSNNSTNNVSLGNIITSSSGVVFNSGGTQLILYLAPNSIAMNIFSQGSSHDGTELTITNFPTATPFVFNASITYLV